MNFDMDDPLGDLSDDDSFFDDPKLTNKRASLTKTPEKKPLTDIFNLSDKPKTVKPETTFQAQEKSSPIKSKKPFKKISFEDDDDLLGNLGLDQQKQPAKSDDLLDNLLPKTIKSSGKVQSDGGSNDLKKKTDLFDDIFTTKTTEKKSSLSFGDILKETKSQSKPPTPTLPEPLLKQDTQQSFSLTSVVPKEGRRSRRGSGGGLADPLGLFSKEPENVTKPLQEDPSTETLFPAKTKTRSAPNISEPGLPDWLSGTKSSKSETFVKNDPLEKPAEQPSETFSETKLSTEHADSIATILKHQKLSQSDIEYQNTFLSLQQQESQLLIALQLKKYEDSLHEIQKQQQEVLNKQEKQFNTILDRYFSRQQLLENNLKLQQERINGHIQMLLTHQSGTSMNAPETEEKMKSIETEEKIQFHESIIESMKQRHREEVFLMEESYKKQITILEQQIELLENRSKNEIENVTKTFVEKIANLKKSYEDDLISVKEKLESSNTNHHNDLKMLREDYKRIIDEIKHEHSIKIENFKKLKDYENNLMNDSRNYSEKLDVTLSELSNNSKVLLKLQENVQNDYGVLSLARENSLQVKEKQVELMRETLNKCREKAENERAQLLGLIRSLEMKLAQQNEGASEDRWALQQAVATVNARSAALDREMDFNRASIEREREQLKTFKESLLAEQEKILLQLTEEKLALAAEKSRIEISHQLNTNFDVEKAKAEAQAAIQIAKESTLATDRERESLHRQKIEVERLKRQLIDRDNELTEKSRELDEMLMNANKKAKDGENAVNESRRLEAVYKDRMQELQKQMSLLTNREKKLAEEKLMLSREKLSLYTIAKQSKKCGLCTVENSVENYETEWFDGPRIINDTDSVRFRLELEEERTSEVSKEEI